MKVYKLLANKFGIPAKRTVETWVKAYEVLVHPVWKEDCHIKQLDALHYKLRTDESYQDVALRFAIHQPSIISNWMRVWQREGIDGLSKSRGVQLCRNRKINH